MRTASAHPAPAYLSRRVSSLLGQHQQAHPSYLLPRTCCAHELLFDPVGVVGSTLAVKYRIYVSIPDEVPLDTVDSLLRCISTHPAPAAQK